MKRLFIVRGHDVHSVGDERLEGHADADIRLYPPAHHAGIWVLRSKTQSIADVIGRAALPLLDSEPLGQRLWIVESARVRIRA